MQKIDPNLLLVVSIPLIFLLGGCSLLYRKPTAVHNPVADAKKDKASSKKSEELISKIRMQVSQTEAVEGCSQTLTSTIKKMALYKIKLPGCPKKLLDNAIYFTENRFTYLNSKDKAFLEGMVATNCREIFDPDKLIDVTVNVQRFLGLRLQVLNSATKQTDTRGLKNIFEAVDRIQNSYLPLAKRLNQEGKFILSESDINEISALVSKKCSIRLDDISKWLSIVDAYRLYSRRFIQGEERALLLMLANLIESEVNESIPRNIFQ